MVRCSALAELFIELVMRELWILEHTNKKFDIDLEYINSQFLQMGKTVSTMIDEAIMAFVKCDMDLVETVIERENKINHYEIEIDEQISYILARHQPAAIDLRILLSVSKMLTDMERSGDEAEKIAKAGCNICMKGYSNFVSTVELQNMASNARSMLDRTLDAFVRLDPMQAAGVVRSDKEVDREWKGVFRHLITYMIENRQAISRATNMIFIARALERIGDHAKNMSERIIYMVNGTDVRHTGLRNAELTAKGEI